MNFGKSAQGLLLRAFVPSAHTTFPHGFGPAETNDFSSATPEKSGRGDHRLEPSCPELRAYCEFPERTDDLEGGDDCAHQAGIEMGIQKPLVNVRTSKGSAEHGRMIANQIAKLKIIGTRLTQRIEHGEPALVIGIHFQRLKMIVRLAVTMNMT
jgi:hypothetical protein